ncbi:DNA-packaging protein gp3 [Chitinophaga eiseniae]|uniref:DNA-packaging protein gp3 n=1 Tax=Chitinophaga eiseniae TaxID=634771 RepID=A0A1T4SP15_9BACT|nr:terminase small subunit [Chitinophaga eiseniae]SKA29922.1 DNA-packaging protein gp3 [Chitinophaga eiseniae]
MAAPIGNQFWKLRSKHGRDLIFSSPELLWEAATEYFEWCDDHPWEKHDFVGKDAEEVYRKVPRPYTIKALCLYLECDDELLDNYQEKEGFSEIVTRIRNIIYTQKYEGAAVGLFNASVIARDLGLVEKSDLTSKGERIGKLDVSNLSDEDLADIARIQQKMAGEG